MCPVNIEDLSMVKILVESDLPFSSFEKHEEEGGVYP